MVCGINVKTIAFARHLEIRNARDKRMSNPIRSRHELPQDVCAKGIALPTMASRKPGSLRHRLGHIG